MDKLFELLITAFPKWTAVFTTILFIIYLILQISDDFDKVKNVVIRVLDIRKHIDTLIYKRLRKNYDRVLASKDYLDWQRKVMEKIYQPLIDDKNAEWRQDTKGNHIPRINITELSFHDKEEPVSYESVTLHLKPLVFPFNSVCKKEKLETKDDITKLGKSEKKANDIFMRKYYRLVRATIRYPKRLGYMLKNISVDKNDGDWEIESYSGTYENNVKTSHILEYELYKYYKKHKNVPITDGKSILKHLKIR